MIPDDVPSFMKAMLGCTTLESARDFADEVMAVREPEKRNRMLLNGTQSNPMFVPHMKEQAPQLQASQWLNAVALARMTAANATHDRIIVSAPMKTGSTFIADILSRGLGLPKVSLTVMTVQPYYFVLLGAGGRAHEVDELALITACLNGRGFVAHHHMHATPYLARLAKLYGIKFALVKRNLFDCMVSLEDFVLEGVQDPAREFDTVLRNFLPLNWGAMDEETRIGHLLDRYLPFYIQYYTSWRMLESRGEVEPIWLSYEEDLLGGSDVLASKIAHGLGRDAGTADKITAQLTRGDALQNVNFNKGVKGRGARITGRNRLRVLDMVEQLRGVVDLTDLI